MTTQPKVFNPLLNETFVFRPIADSHNLATLRYSNGAWIPDDGEVDLAFVQYNCMAYGVQMPSYSNLLWSWMDYELTKKWLPEHLHKHSQGHHYMTVDNTPLSEEFRRYKFPDDDKHPNAIAYRAAMDKCCNIYGCANGRGPHLVNANYDIGKYIQADQYIKRGLLRIQRTSEPIVIPANLKCILCADNGRGHLLEALQSTKDAIESSIEYSQELIGKAQSDINNEEYNMERAKEHLAEITETLAKMEVLSGN